MGTSGNDFNFCTNIEDGMSFVSVLASLPTPGPFRCGTLARSRRPGSRCPALCAPAKLLSAQVALAERVRPGHMDQSVGDHWAFWGYFKGQCSYMIFCDSSALECQGLDELRRLVMWSLVA